MCRKWLLYINAYTFTYCKELGNMVGEFSRTKICRVSRQVGPRRADAAIAVHRLSGWRPRKSHRSRFCPKANRWRIPTARGMEGVFVLGRPAPDWMRPILTMEGNLLYSKSVNSRLFPIQSLPMETPRIRPDQVSGHHCPATLIQDINHHSSYLKKQTKQNSEHWQRCGETGILGHCW